MEQDIKEAKGARTLTNHLTAQLNAAGKVEILGDKARVKLPHKSGAHTFKFHLTDNTDGLNVCFSAFGAELGETCPSSPGDNTGQITGLDIQDKSAEFTDENTGDKCTFGYSWFFSCNDANQHPVFDPIVDNGGNKV